MNKSQKKLIRTLTLAAMCLALAIVLPFLTMQIPQIGQALSPMHIPALLCGIICGPFWGAAVGFVAPLLRHLMFGMPPLMTAIAMAFELAAYGFSPGCSTKYFRRRFRISMSRSSGAMIVGRIVWGIVKFFISIAQASEFTFAAFIAGAVTGAIPGIICHIILVPLIVIALKKARLVPEDTLATA